MSSIGKKITKYRKDNNLTQEKLSEKIGVDIKTISRWERDENQPSSDAIKKISEVLNIKVSELIDGCETNEENKHLKKEKIINRKMQIILSSIAITLFLLAISNIIIYRLTKNYYDLHYYEVVSYDKTVLVSGNLIRNKGMNTIFIDNINYLDKENPRGTIGAIKTNHVVVELLSNSKFMTSRVIDCDELEYLYNLLDGVRFYFSVRENAEGDYKGFDYKNMSIRISYGENKVIETNLVLKEIES